MVYRVLKAIIIATSSPAQVAKLVDAGDSKSPAARCVGSSPTLGTTTTFRAVIFFVYRTPYRKSQSKQIKCSCGFVSIII